MIYYDRCSFGHPHYLFPYPYLYVIMKAQFCQCSVYITSLHHVAKFVMTTWFVNIPVLLAGRNVFPCCTPSPKVRCDLLQPKIWEALVSLPNTILGQGIICYSHSCSGLCTQPGDRASLCQGPQVTIVSSFLRVQRQQQGIVMFPWPTLTDESNTSFPVQSFVYTTHFLFSKSSIWCKTLLIIIYTRSKSSR
jgi:hypothetical protein